MTQTPAERRAQRDAMARGRLNPDTAQPFVNYNQLDTWQRNQKAKTLGFKNRYERVKRQRAGPGPELRRALELPNSFDNYLNGRIPTEALARDFNDAFGKGSYISHGPKSRRLRNEALRLRFASEEGWDWRVWRDEYAEL